MYRYLGLGCMILNLAACCECRTSIAADELQTLKIGQTTTDDIKADFGLPSETSSTGAETIWAYKFNYEDKTLTDYIPVLSSVFNNLDNRAQTDMFVFDGQGKLKRYTRTDAAILPSG